MSNLTSSLTVRLVDDVSKPARTVAQALKQAEAAAKAVAEGMKGAGASDRFIKNLSGLKLAGKDIETVANAWKDYAKSAGLAADSANWTKSQAASVAAWEKQTIAALRAVKREQASFAKSIGKMDGAGVSPMMAAMSQGAIANQKMLAGMAVMGRRGVSAPSAMTEGKAGRWRGFMSEQARDFASGMVMGSIPMMAGMKAYEGGKNAINQAATYQHLQVGLKNMGMTVGQMTEINEMARKVSRESPGTSINDALAQIKETIGAFGSVEHAVENAGTLAKINQVLKAAGREGVNTEDSANNFVRFMEERGATNDPTRLTREMKEQARSMVFYGERYNPQEMLQYAQRAKGSVASLNEDFTYGIMPSIVSMRGGDIAGTETNQFMNTIKGRVKDKTQAQAWVDLGLIDPKQVVEGKNGPISWKAGAIKGTDEWLSNPYAAGLKYLLPALEKKGVNTNDRLELDKALSTLFRNSSANTFAQDLYQYANRQRIDKDMRLRANTGDFDTIHKRTAEEDPRGGVAKLEAAMSTLETATLKSAPIATGLDILSNAIMKQADLITHAGEKWDRIREQSPLAQASKAAEEKAKAEGRKVTPGDQFNAFWKEIKGRWSGSKESATKITPAAPIPVRDLRPSFTKLGEEAFLLPQKKAKGTPFAQKPEASPIGVTGLMQREQFPTMTTAPEAQKAFGRTIVPKPAPLPPPPVAAPVIKQPAAAPTPAPIAPPPSAPAVAAPKPIAPAPLPAQEMTVVPTVAPMPAQQIEVNPVVSPLPAFAAQEVKVNPTFGDLPPLPPMEVKVTPVFEQMQGAAPSVKVEGLDTAKAGLGELKSELTTVGSTSVSPTVSTSSIQGAIGEVRQLLGLLGQVQGAANGAAGAATNAAASAKSAAAQISSLGKIQRGNFSYGGVKGE